MKSHIALIAVSGSCLASIAPAGVTVGLRPDSARPPEMTVEYLGTDGRVESLTQSTPDRNGYFWFDLPTPRGSHGAGGGGGAGKVSFSDLGSFHAVYFEFLSPGESGVIPIMEPYLVYNSFEKPALLPKVEVGQVIRIADGRSDDLGALLAYSPKSPLDQTDPALLLDPSKLSVANGSYEVLDLLRFTTVPAPGSLVAAAAVVLLVPRRRA